MQQQRPVAMAAPGCPLAPCRLRPAPPHRRAAASPRRGPGGMLCLRSLQAKHVDVVALGNLCLDIVIPVPALPPADAAVRRRLLDDLTRSPPDTSAWEVGGSCNFLIAAARLGLQAVPVGHLGQDRYGRFMTDVLQASGEPPAGWCRRG